MRYFWSIFGIIASVFMLKFRERIGESMGEAEWMQYVGGVYTVVVVAALFIFFWCVATLTGTERLFFYPIIFLIPKMGNTLTPS
jgi:hypothetical protein